MTLPHDSADRTTARCRRTRPWWASLLLIAATIALGLVLRLVPLGLPGFVVKYGGSLLWALMIFWIVSAILVSRPRIHPAPVALAIAFAVEFFKLVHTPWLDAFRTTTPGALLLGRHFSIQDLVAYTLAIASGAMVDKVVSPPN